MNAKFVTFPVIGGAVVTLLTGFLANIVLLGAEHYGYPMAWLIRLVLAPEYFPWRVNVPNLIVDLTVWTIIAGILVALLTRRKKSP